MAELSAQPMAWHSLPEGEIFRVLETGTDGLREAQCAVRLAEYGPNALPEHKPPAAAVIFLQQFLSPLIYVLLAAGAVAVAMGDATDAVFILTVVTLNAVLGSYQEWKAERSAASLQQLLHVVARVKRNGEWTLTDAAGLVPGDWIHLESGARVPADIRLVETNQLTVDEAFLTGESHAAEKFPGVLAEEAGVGDRTNMVFAGAMVLSGRGTGVVAATGLRTEVGRIAKSVTLTDNTKPPLVIRMERFARHVSVGVLIACALLGATALAKGMAWKEVFFLSIALAVSAIPEGLPVAMTVALSIAANRMARRNVIVRKLTAVEGLGSCTFIATDKTGTLTHNKQSVAATWLAGPDRTEEELAEFAMFSSEVVPAFREGRWSFTGDAVDAAFWEFGVRHGLDPEQVSRTRRLGEVPYESGRAFAAAFFQRNGQVVAAVKGAPEVLLERCRADGPARAELERLSAAGYRVIAVASGVCLGADPARRFREEDLPGLELVGFAGLLDPPRAEVREAVEKCRRSGIAVAMITGDHPLTALAIANQTGIPATAAEVVTGKELAEIGTPEAPLFLATVRRGRVFARVSPTQKLEIVEALGQLGHFVAVTGDGVNDAPALKRANIGVAMGSGTDVAKETASLIVTDDNFASIEAGVEEGRFAYDNVRKVIYLLVATGFAEVFLFVLTMMTGLPIPLLPVQLLWLNLVTNGIQDVALAFEGGEPETMRRPPRRPAEGIFNNLMLRQCAVAGIVTAAVAYGNFHLFVETMQLELEDARNRLLLLMVWIENVQVFNCRSEYVSVFRIPVRRNWMLLGGVLGAQAVHIAAMFIPWTQGVLRVAPVSFAEWIAPVLMAATVLATMEIFKVAQHGWRVAWRMGEPTCTNNGQTDTA